MQDSPSPSESRGGFETDALNLRGFEALSSRETQVIAMAAVGLSDKQISHELQVSTHTLRTYWDRIRSKVGNATRPALVAAFASSRAGLAAHHLVDVLGLRGWVMDTETEMVTASDSVNELYRLKKGVPHPADAYIGKIHPEDAEKVKETLALVAAGEMTAVQIAYRLKVKDSPELINVAVCGIADESGKVDRVFGFRIEVVDCRPEGSN